MKARADKLLIAGSAALFILAGLFPPWKLEVNLEKTTHSEKAVGWHSIFSPPEIKSMVERFYPDFRGKLIS